MTETALPKEGIRALLAELSGLDEENVLWDGESVPFVATGLLTITVKSRHREGIDEEDTTFPSETQTTIKLKGVRSVTLSIRADQFDGDDGFDLLEQLRFDLAVNENRETLRELGVSYAESADVQQLDYFVDNRQVSAAALDIFLNQIVTATRTKTTSGGYIDKVDMNGEPETETEVFEVDGTS